MTTQTTPTGAPAPDDSQDAVQVAEELLDAQRVAAQLDGSGDQSDLKSGEHEFTSLLDAMNRMRIPVANHAAITQLTESIGAQRYRLTSAYIVAERPGSGPALHIAFGYTNGFASKEEASRATGGILEVWPSKARPKTWGVSHPENKTRTARQRARAKDQDRRTCPNCHLQMPRTGECDNCD